VAIRPLNRKEAWAIRQSLARYIDRLTGDDEADRQSRESYFRTLNDLGVVFPEWAADWMIDESLRGVKRHV
jgi:hypothetical protein